MKKIIYVLALTIISFGAKAGETNVNSRVLEAFKADFTHATNVQWTITNDVSKASFTYNDISYFAFYNANGELMGTTRYVTLLNLPIKLQSSLRNDYGSYWVSNLFEVNNADGLAYYITIEDADSKIVLKSDNGKDWTKHSKKVKA